MEALVYSQVSTSQIGNVLTSNDKGLMSDIYNTLKKHNALKRFGVSLLQDDFAVGSDEVLIEHTSMSKRTQLITPHSKSAIPNAPIIDTNWRLDTGVPIMSCQCITGGPEGGHQHYERG